VYLLREHFRSHFFSNHCRIMARDKKGTKAASSSSLVDVGINAFTSSLPSSGHTDQIFRRLAKKDAITRQKALAQLLSSLKASPDEENYIPALDILPNWASDVFSGIIVSDIDRLVRLKAVQAHAKLIELAGKGIKPYLKDVIAAWLTCFFDSSRDIATVSRSCFNVSLRSDE
jgi:hypothetical protein